MTATQKKTLGLAIGSLVCGCFFIIPLLGALLGLIAIILGIIALVQINNNKEEYKGSGLAITGIVLGSVSILIIPVIALLAAIAIPNFLRAKISANEALAQSTLRTLATASETYATERNGQYPGSESDLISADPPYLTNGYCGTLNAGYQYQCEFTAQGYQFIAAPSEPGSSGTMIFTVKTGGIMEKSDANPVQSSY